MRVFATAIERYGHMTPTFLAAASDRASEICRAVDVTMKGKEGKLPPGTSFRDKDGHDRTEVQTRWYLPAEGQVYRSYSLQTDVIDCDEPVTAEVIAAVRPYPSDAPPVFFGHYWLSADRPTLLAPNVTCLDFSVAKGGFLCAYRWDEKWTLDPSRFVVARCGTGQ